MMCPMANCKSNVKTVSTMLTNKHTNAQGLYFALVMLTCPKGHQSYCLTNSYDEQKNLTRMEARGGKQREAKEKTNAAA